MNKKWRITIPVSLKDKIGLSIHTEDERLLKMVSLNWGADDSSALKELNLYIDSEGRSAYSIERLQGDSWLCKGVYHYSSLKVAIRGILSDAEIQDTIFIHGCSFELQMGNNRRGVALIGASGAGKTTLVSGLVNEEGMNFGIVNDDWGAMNISEKIAVSTEENYLHMKLKSAESIQPCFTKESMIMLEEYRDGMRGFTAPDKVYPYRITHTKIFFWIILIRDIKEQHYYKKIGIDEAIDIIINGSFSPFYNRKERFMNGALILDSEEKIEYHKQILHCALENTKLILINNTGSEEELIGDFKAAISSGEL